ncbi:hypothetical protein ACIQ9P_31905 [Kitasatospora sp. NPDC094019]|uniref:hypothetical protein n=1 Tax=Kitasatospora sp. NPDC094019 TaxID=3364091 RepID=UPI0037FD1325
MTTERVLAACRSNWEYRGIDEASVREMLDELDAHLQDAAAAGRSAQDVVGKDVRTFAAAWARARAPLSRRILRTAGTASFVLGVLLLLSHLIRRSAELEVTADRVVFWAVIAAVTVAWELRRGSLGLRRSWGVSLVAGLPALLLTRHFFGDQPLLTLPLWVAPLFLVPGLPFVLADVRARRAMSPVGG